MTEQPPRVSGKVADGRRSVSIESPRSERTESWSVPQPAPGFGGLRVFWGAVAMAFGGGALVLQYLGPPERPAAFAHAGTRPEGMRFASEEAWVTHALPDAARPFNPSPILALWPGERMRTGSEAARAAGAATLASGNTASVGASPDGDRSAPIDFIAPVRPPWSQVTAAGTEAPSASVPGVATNGGSDDVLSTEATRPPPLPLETGSDAPEPASGSEGASSGGGASPATVGATAGAGSAQAPDAIEDDETPASVSRSRADEAAAGGRDGGPVATQLLDLGGAVAPAQAFVPIAAPTDASEEPAAADVQDLPHADPQSARGHDGPGSAGVRLPPATEFEAAPAVSAPSGTAPDAEPPPAQDSSQAFVPPTADAHAADPAAASAAETASPSAIATADALPATAPPANPVTHTESLPAPVQPAETAVPSPAAASVAASATKPQRRPPSGASTTAVAALLARGDALIAIGDVAAARLVYQRAAAHASARAATATGKTYDPRFLQAIGAIGVIADLDAAAAWYRRGSALGDEDATSLMGDLEVNASR